MDLINTTGVPAELTVSSLGPDEEGRDVRLGSLALKATLDVDRDGLMTLAADPLPVQDAELPCELGVLPRDLLPPRPEAVELMVLGAAHGPGGRPVREMIVALEVGERRWELAVTGERRWGRGADGGWTLSEPAPFQRMPLRWERAFGGTAEVWIDDASPVDVSHPLNPGGRGFDPTPLAEGLARTLGCPPSYPRVRYDWAAPNVEHPARRVRRPDAATAPYCWAPMPIELGLRTTAVSASLPELDPSTEAAVGEVRGVATKQDPYLWFAHPDLRVPSLPPGTPVALEGLSPEGPLRFPWPGLGWEVDYTLGGRRGTRRLLLQTVLLFPEQRRVAATFRTWFRFRVEAEGLERSMRIRAVEGER